MRAWLRPCGLISNAGRVARPGPWGRRNCGHVSGRVCAGSRAFDARKHSAPIKGETANIHPSENTPAKTPPSRNTRRKSAHQPSTRDRQTSCANESFPRERCGVHFCSQQEAPAKALEHIIIIIKPEGALCQEKGCVSPRRRGWGKELHKRSHALRFQLRTQR